MFDTPQFMLQLPVLGAEYGLLRESVGRTVDAAYACREAALVDPEHAITLNGCLFGFSRACQPIL